MSLMSSYPQGFTNGVQIRGVPIAQTHSGKVYWVYNGTGLIQSQRGGSDANRGTYDSPFATIAYAVSQCVANRGDVIFVKAGHAETISDSTTFALNIAGVAIIGLGLGSSRPSFTIGTANTATIPVSADNISIQNCRFVANFLSIASCFTLTTAKNFTVQSCGFVDNSGVLNFLNLVKSTGAANTIDGIAFLNNRWDGLGTTSVNTAILSANDINGALVIGNRIKMVRTADAAILMVITAGVLTNLDCGDNVCYSAQTTTANGSLINVGGTTSNGWVYRNYVQTLTTTSDKLFTTTVGLSAFDNRVTGVVGASGFLIPAADS